MRPAHKRLKRVQIDRTDPHVYVEMVHRQLEILKFVGSWKTQIVDGRPKEVPTGQGINVGIVLLPDLVMDIHEAAITKRGKRCKGKRRTCAVGGRAARCACTLLHLLDDYDGTFWVRLLTKTGNLGRLLLENEFHNRSSTTLAAGMLRDTVRDNGGEPRYALLTEKKIDSPRSDPSNELGAKDFADEPLLAETMRAARVICLSSIKSNLKELWRQIPKEGNNSAAPLVFLDTTRADASDVHSLRGLLGQHDRPAIHAVFFDLTPPSDEKTRGMHASEQKRRAEDFLESRDAPVVLYGKRGVTCQMPRGQSVRVKCGADFASEDIAECFKAGVLLVWAVFRAIAEVEHRHAGLASALQQEWRDLGGPWKVALEYGVRIALARQRTGDTSCSLRDLLGMAKRTAGTDHWISNGQLPIPKLKLAESAGPKVLDIDRTQMAPLARLAGYRRRHVAEGDASKCKGSPRCRDLARCSRTDECRDAERVHPEQDHRDMSPAAVLIDLDGTLMDSTEARDQGLRVALPHLQVDDKHIENKLDWFTRNVYNLHCIFHALGHGDFRQEWNHPGWYTAYILFITRPKLRKSIQDWITRSGINLNKPSTDHIEQIHRAAWKDELKKGYAEVSRTHSDKIELSRAVFEKVQMHALKEARDFLKSLQLTGAFTLYVVSEGNPQTQWMKIRNTGLAEFFDQHRVLTTGDAAEPTKERASYAAEMGVLNKEAADIAKAKRKMEDWQSRFTKFRNSVEKSIQTRDGEFTDIVREHFLNEEDALRADLLVITDDEDRNRKQRDAGVFVGKVLDRMAEKGGISFYAAAIRAILRRPQSPLSALRSLEELLGRCPKGRMMKFAMIGDRQKKDIEPPASLLEKTGIVTIRLESGKYWDEETTAPRHPPSHIVETLAGAKAVLLSKDTWAASRLRCSGDPPIFNWRILPKGAKARPDEYEVRLEDVLEGMKMYSGNDRVISRICAGVFAEHFGSAENAEWKAALEDCLDSNRVDRARNDVDGARLIRTDIQNHYRIVDAIERTGALAEPHRKELVKEFVGCLDADAVRLEDLSADVTRLEILEDLKKLMGDLLSRLRRYLDEEAQ